MTSIPNEADFLRFMQVNGPQNQSSRRNYLSWLRYVNELYGIDYENLTSTEVDNVLQQLKETQSTRDRYTSNASISNIQSALNKYLAFISGGDSAPSIITDISSITDVTSTTTKTKTDIETRLGQGKYRQGVISIWKKCAVTEIDRIDLLIASHIKPWHKSINAERIDPYNGLLLSPTLDKLFDRGYISFADDGRLLKSPLLDDMDLQKLGIKEPMKLYKIETGCQPYLKFHRDYVFIKEI